MRIEELIQRASAAYPDNKVIESFQASRTIQTSRASAAIGDTLATFIASELESTFEERRSTQEKLRLARNTLDRAIAELEAVRDAL